MAATFGQFPANFTFCEALGATICMRDAESPVCGILNQNEVFLIYNIILKNCIFNINFFNIALLHMLYFPVLRTSSICPREYTTTSAKGLYFTVHPLSGPFNFFFVKPEIRLNISPVNKRFV